MKRINPSTPFFWGLIGALIGFIGAVNLGKDDRFVDGALGAFIQFFIWYAISGLTLKRRRKLREISALSRELQSQDQSLASGLIGWVQGVYKTGSAPPLPKIGLKVWFTVFLACEAVFRLLNLWEENRRIYAGFDFSNFQYLLNEFFNDVFSPLFIDLFIFPNLLDAFIFTSAIYLYRKFKSRLTNPYHKYGLILLLAILALVVAFFLVVAVGIILRLLSS